MQPGKTGLLGDEQGDFREVFSNLESDFNQQVYSAFIKPLQVVAFDESNRCVTLAAPSKLLCRHVESYAPQLENAFAKHLGVSKLKISLTVSKEGALSDRVTLADEVSSASEKPVVVKKVRLAQASTAGGGRGASGIDPRYTFDNFVVGNSNQFCHAAARRVAESPGRSYNPLFIYGGVGLGKTHLLHAIANTVLQHRPDSRVLYISAEAFMNELIKALRHARMEEFKNRFRTVHVLLIDDIQFLCGKERTQEEFFHTFNALYNAKHQIVVTSDKIPQDIFGLEERLRTRFSWGLTADLQAPDFETRVAILNRKAALEQFDLPGEVAHLVAESVSSNVRELEGALNRLNAMSSLQGQAITTELAKSALRPLLEPKVVNITVDDIKKSVANHFDLKVSELISKRRTRNLSFPRHIAMYLCRKHTTASYPEIGGHFGGRDHSSVIHAANVVSTKIKQDSSVKELVDRVEQELLGSLQ